MGAPAGVSDRVLLSGPTDLSRIVRPFTTDGSVLTRNRTERGFFFGTPTYQPPSTSEGQQDGTLTWSATQDAQTTTLESFGFTIDWGDDSTNFTEISRTTHTERITNPDDDTQFVDVEVADSIQYKDTKNIVSKYLFVAS